MQKEKAVYPESKGMLVANGTENAQTDKQQDQRQTLLCEYLKWVGVRDTIQLCYLPPGLRVLTSYILESSHFLYASLQHLPLRPHFSSQRTLEKVALCEPDLQFMHQITRPDLLACLIFFFKFLFIYFRIEY